MGTGTIPGGGHEIGGAVFWGSRPPSSVLWGDVVRSRTIQRRVEALEAKQAPTVAYIWLEAGESVATVAVWELGP